ncbi:glycosyl hydrolase catalytic core-domain-containing protein [Pseudoneurospora amorphoporcata]|uniref:Glycosyl hydrolase catalytic core-domain-containing protein n=1 Tax=Pseudoneurospora amorphoporcata TaxID=241081 RepID=A0AAN6NN66_9PEZI|nr:glycosyl hydrolase catalytic core-domain-containing protein [Pseudoneurospora amorphoporcata]
MPDQIHDLSTWDNVAPRTYTGRVICFPFDDDARKNQSESAQTLLASLRNSLDVLVQQRPDFAGKLQLGANLAPHEKQAVTKYKDGYVYLLTSSNYSIYLRPKYPRELESMYGKVTARNGTEHVKAQGINFDENLIDYDTLKRSTFPVKPFINQDLTTDLTLEEGKGPIPVVEVQVIFLNGGFFLNLLIHHTYFDGKAYHNFLECLAACTRGDKIPKYPTSPMVKLPYEQDLDRSLAEKTFEELLPLCPEFQTWPNNDLLGPTQPVQRDIPNSESLLKNDSKIFVFQFSKLKTLSLELAHLLPTTAAPSAYTTLCALLWAHTLLARETFLKSPPSSSSQNQSEHALHTHFSSFHPFFSTPVDWSRSSTRLLQKYQYPSSASSLSPLITKSYFGNTVTWAITTLPSISLLHDIAKTGSKTCLALVASAISLSISQINPSTSFLHTREALFDKVPDMRMLGLPWDSRMPAEWGMNSWVDFGADIHWSLPGVACAVEGVEELEKRTWTLADAQRRVQKEVAGSGGLILPAKRARPENWECQVSLPEGAMRALEADEHEQKLTKASAMTNMQVLNETASESSETSSNSTITTHPLSLWNNIAPRCYTPRALCFPLSSSARLSPLTTASTLLWFLRMQLLRVINVRPAFAGKLQLGINLSEPDKLALNKTGKYNPWHVYLHTAADYEIPLVAQYPDDEETQKMYGGIEARFEPHGAEGWPPRFVDYDQLKREEFPVEPFINPLLTDLRTLKEGGETLPAIQVRVLFLKGGFILIILGHHTLFDGGSFTQFLNVLAEHTTSSSPTWEGVPGVHDLALSLPTIEKPYEELLAKCPEYNEWEDHAPNGPTHPVCPSLPGREGDSLTGSSKIFVFTFAKLVRLQKEIAAAHGVKAGIYECLSGLLWSLTYLSRVTASSSSSSADTDPCSFEKFLHDHFAEEQPVFSTPTDWMARVAALKSTDPEVVAFKEQMAKDTKAYLGNKITWISTRLPSASMLIDAANAAKDSQEMDLAALAKIVAAMNKSSTDMAENMAEYITMRTSLFAAGESDIRRIGLSFDPRQPSEWQMNSWKNFGADTEWRFPLRSSSSSVLMPMVPANAFCAAASASHSHREAFNVTKPDAVRRVQARYGISGGLWLPARKEQKTEVLVQVSLPEEAMGVFEGLVLEGGWVERVIAFRNIDPYLIVADPRIICGDTTSWRSCHIVDTVDSIPLRHRSVTTMLSLLALSMCLPALATATTSPKRGLIFIPNTNWPKDDQIWLTGPNNLTWYHNYQSLPSPESDYAALPQKQIQFVPTMWGGNENDTDFLANVTALMGIDLTKDDDKDKRARVKRNITHVMTFNKPDQPFDVGGSEMAPRVAAKAWIKNIIPLRRLGLKVGLPLVDKPHMGREEKSWLDMFFANCSGLLDKLEDAKEKTCGFDFVPVYSFGSFETLKERVGMFENAFPGLDIWITEFGFPAETLENTQKFYNQSIPYLDSKGSVKRYAWFGAFRSIVSNVGPNQAFLDPYGKLTDIGSWYLGGNATGREALPSDDYRGEDDKCTKDKPCGGEENGAGTLQPGRLAVLLVVVSSLSLV